MAVTVHSKPKPGVTAQEIERWRKVPTAIVADVSDGACLIDPAISPLMPPGQQPRLFGFAVTAVCEPPDFGAVLHALDKIEPGDILVIDAKGNRHNAVIGEILGGHLRRKGAAGIVCDGAVRDVAELAGWKDLSVFTRHITPRGPTAAQRGAVNAPARIGGHVIAPGDLIIGDDDGLVFLNEALIRTLIENAEAKLAVEVKWQESLATGKSIKETFGL